MKDYFIRKKYFRTGILILLILVISIPAVFRLVRPGFFPMYDDMQVIRVEQMDKCIKDGQIPCRWVPDLGYGYGYPLFQYYSPLPYYFMEGVHLVGFSFIDSVKIGFIASIYLSALFFFLLSKKYFANSTSLLLAFAYVMLPFRAADVYVRGAMGEAWGLAMLPAYLWGFEKFIKDKNLFSFSLFSFFGGLFLITHNLTFLMSLPLLIVWFLVRLKDEKKLITYVFSAVLVSLSLASFYLLPLIAEKNLVHMETLTQGYFNFVNHFSSLKQIFFSLGWGYGPSQIGSMDDAFVGIGPIHAIIGILGYFTILISRKKKNFIFFTVLIILAFIYAFLMHSRSSFLWNGITYMKYFQFPWRFSLPASFIFAFLAGVYVEKVPKLVKIPFYLAFFALVIFIYGHYFAPKYWVNIDDTEKLSGEARQLAVTASIYDYLPKSAKINPAEAAPTGLIIKSGQVTVFSSLRGTNWYKYVLDVESDNAEVVIPAYDFPGWRVKVNGETVSYEYYGELGLLSVNLKKGEKMLEAKLKKTSLKNISDWVSLVSFVTVAGFLSISKFKRKKII